MWRWWLVLATALWSSGASAEEVVGTVVSLDGGDLVVDLGADRGLSGGMRVEIWRPLRLKHPVTGKVLTDRFRIGELEVGQVRKQLSLASPVGELSRDPAVGDVVLFTKADRAPPVAGQTPASPPSPGSLDADPEAKRIGEMFDALRGADLVRRIRTYEDYVRANPNGRFAGVLYEEAAALRRLVTRRESSVTPQAPRPVAPSAGLRGYQRPGEVEEGRAVRFAVELEGGATGAVLHTRSRLRQGDWSGQGPYTSTPMLPVGKGYFAATVEEGRVSAPELEYFIEATSVEGARAIVGTATSPETVAVRERAKPVASKQRAASASVSTDYADYNRLHGNDRVWQTEGNFGVRYGDVGVRALRTGFGVYRGVGGTLAELDQQGLQGRKVGLTYGYLEGEIGIVRSVGLIGRASVGLLDDGVSGGGQLIVRIGSDLETNLLLGGEVLGGVGLRSFAELDLNVFERWPIVVRTEVTNQPAGAAPSREQQGPGIAQGDGEVGARGIAQVGFRVTQPFVVAVRGSVQGRTIKHAGPGGGLAVGYQW